MGACKGRGIYKTERRWTPAFAGVTEKVVGCRVT